MVLNFINDRNTHFVEEQELNPSSFAERFADPDPTKALSPEDLLNRARMIVSTELGKDPVLRQEMRDLFKHNAIISVSPTERGINKIDEHHAYFVCYLNKLCPSIMLNSLQNFKYLQNKRAAEMLQSPQFLQIVAAESEHLVTVSIDLPADAKARFERKLNDAFASDGFSDTARAWNEERSRVVHETLEDQLIPVGAKWTREWLREESEDYLANHCAQVLREVSINIQSYKLILSIPVAD